MYKQYVLHVWKLWFRGPIDGLSRRNRELMDMIRKYFIATGYERPVITTWCSLGTYAGRAWKYQRINQKPLIEGQIIQWPKQKGRKDKQPSTKIIHKTKDRVTLTPLKTWIELRKDKQILLHLWHPSCYSSYTSGDVSCLSHTLSATFSKHETFIYYCHKCVLSQWMCSWRGVLDTNDVITLVSDLWQVGGFLRVLRFPPPINLTVTILLKHCWKWR